MCFTPFVSITVALIEFCLATILITCFRRTTLRNFFGLLIFCLGFYQFTEFMLCTSTNPLFWAKLGFATYTFLPAIALHTTIRFVKKKPNLFLIYVVPVVASIFAFLFRVVTNPSCQTFFVQTKLVFNQIAAPFNEAVIWVYLIYYFGFIILSFILFLAAYEKERNKTKRKISLVEMAGILFMTVPTLIFIVIFPIMGKRFPSVLCGFAIFVSVAAFVAAYLEGKLKA